MGSKVAGKKSRLMGFLSRKADYLMVFPAVIWMAIFLFIPIIIIIVTSFYTLVGYTPQPIFTLENYATVLFAPHYQSIILFTLKLAFQVTVVCFIIGFPAAYFMATRIKSNAVQTLIILVLLIPFWIDWTVRTIAWYPLLGKIGLINMVLMSTGLVSEPLGMLMQSEFSATVAMVEAYLLFMIAPIFLSMNRIEPGYIQAAESLGANRFRAFYEVIWKLSLPGVAIGWMFVFVMGMADFATPNLLGGTIQTIGGSTAYAVGILNWPLAGAFGAILIIITFAVVFIILKLVDVRSMLF